MNCLKIFGKGAPRVVNRHTEKMSVHIHDAGIDIYPSRLVLIKGLMWIHTDTHIIVPAGYAGHLVARSSTTTTYGLDIIPGVIDAGYTGELVIRAWYDSMAYDRVNQIISQHRPPAIAQLVIQPVLSVHALEVMPPDYVPEWSTRKSDGFGSTDEKAHHISR